MRTLAIVFWNIHILRCNLGIILFVILCYNLRWSKTSWSISDALWRKLHCHWAITWMLLCWLSRFRVSLHDHKHFSQQNLILSFGFICFKLLLWALLSSSYRFTLVWYLSVLFRWGILNTRLHVMDILHQLFIFLLLPIIIEGWVVQNLPLYLHLEMCTILRVGYVKVHLFNIQI